LLYVGVSLGLAGLLLLTLGRYPAAFRPPPLVAAG
jgi:hypothetical protein